MRKERAVAFVLMLLALAIAAAAFAGRAGHSQALPAPKPVWNDAQLISAGTTPPTEAQCFSAGRRCFTPQSLQAAYNVGPLYASGLNGAGQTIAIRRSGCSPCAARRV
jgi:subtilase family serine protease